MKKSVHCKVSRQGKGMERSPKARRRRTGSRRLVAAPKGEKSLALCFGKAHTQHTRMTHFHKGWRGHRWRVRFGSCPMDGRKVRRSPEATPIGVPSWDR